MGTVLGLDDENKIDATDVAIISLLQEDGRMPAAEIAARLGHALTARAVRYRIQRLTRTGVTSVTAVVHPRAIGYSIMADILIEAEPGRIHEIVRQLAELDEVTYASEATGDQDISIQVVGRSVDELYQFVLNRVQGIAGVRRTRTYLLPLALKFTYNWKVPRAAYAGGDARRESGIS